MNVKPDTSLTLAIEELITANHILGFEGVLDAYGHVSIRHPQDPTRFLLSCSRSPELVGAKDIMEFGLDGEPVGPDDRSPYVERFIHAGVYQARPDVQAVVHSHARGRPTLHDHSGAAASGSPNRHQMRKGTPGVGPS